MSVKEKLFATRNKRKYKSCTVKIDGEDVTFWLRSPTAGERVKFESECLKTVGKGKKTERITDPTQIKNRLIITCVCEGDGKPNPLFNDTEFDALNECAPDAIDALFDVASELSGMTDSDVKELAGN